MRAEFIPIPPQFCVPPFPLSQFCWTRRARQRASSGNRPNQVGHFPSTSPGFHSPFLAMPTPETGKVQERTGPPEQTHFFWQWDSELEEQGWEIIGVTHLMGVRFVGVRFMADCRCLCIRVDCIFGSRPVSLLMSALLFFCSEALRSALKASAIGRPISSCSRIRTRSVCPFRLPALFMVPAARRRSYRAEKREWQEGADFPCCFPHAPGGVEGAAAGENDVD